jgi:hypothetical protein
MKHTLHLYCNMRCMGWRQTHTYRHKTHTHTHTHTHTVTHTHTERERRESSCCVAEDAIP